MKVGADYQGNGWCEFVVWAPFVRHLGLRIIAPEEREIPMWRDDRGYWRVTAGGVFPGALYYYRINGSVESPDPASRCQPQGVHGPSQVIDHQAFEWSDNRWAGIPLSELIIYELHVGTFTPEGTLAAIIPRLTELTELGVNALELMPVSQFPGERNWGYDGVYPFAVQYSYGGPTGLKHLINACHRQGLAVILDVVYNHLGPEGNYLENFGPYFTAKYRTPWGKAINFDEAWSDGVRNYFLENALHWLRDYHVDGLRLDAVHAIYDQSARPFLAELSETVAGFSREQGRKSLLIAESDLNDHRLITPVETGGLGMDAQWCDDFHHSLHTLLTSEGQGYYADFGQVQHLVRACQEGFVYAGEYSVHRRRPHGTSSREFPAERFVVCAQNHDQTGNRMLGERLSTLLSFDALRLAAGAVLLSPFVPLLWMGEEYGEQAPFLYFVSHGDPDLVAAVRAGREAEFEAFAWQGEIPDPQATETFLRSKLNWERRNEGRHRLLLKFYQRLIELRKSIPALHRLDKRTLRVSGSESRRLIFLHRWCDESRIYCVMNFNRLETVGSSDELVFRPDLPPGRWRKVLDSADEVWGGLGSSLPEVIEFSEDLLINPLSLVLYEREAS